MKKITARFNGKCFETKKAIVRGEVMYYDYGAKKCYCLSSNMARIQDKAESERNFDAELMEAHENAYADNQWYAIN